MKKVNLLLAALVCCGAAFAGDLYDDMASTPELLNQWQGGKKNVTLLPNAAPEGKYALAFDCDDANKTVILRFNVPADKVKGKKVEFSAKIKAENVTQLKKIPVTGIKLMLFIQTASGKKIYTESRPLANFRAGSYNWKEFETKYNIPADATNVLALIGLQQASGKVLFSDIDFDIED